MKDFLSEESGQGMAEYALILALISVAVIVSFKLVANNLMSMYNNIANDVAAT